MFLLLLIFTPIISCHSTQKAAIPPSIDALDFRSFLRLLHFLQKDLFIAFRVEDFVDIDSIQLFYFFYDWNYCGDFEPGQIFGLD